MKIGFLMRRHPPTRRSPIMPEVVSILAEWGAEIELLYPDEEIVDLGRLRPRHDLYVLRSNSELALSLAGALHAGGAAVLNPYPVAAMLRNKIISTQVLLAAGVPVPETFVTGEPESLAAVLDNGPLVVKPHTGSDGVGVRVVWDTDDLIACAGQPGPMFAMRYHPGDGRDRKIYCIGGQLFGVKRTWPVRSYDDKLGDSFTLDHELRAIAIACGEAFGIDLFGVDIIISDGRPWVVDMSSFPGFKGVPNAALRLADYIYAAAARAVAGEPVLAGVGAAVGAAVGAGVGAVVGAGAGVGA